MLKVYCPLCAPGGVRRLDPLVPGQFYAKYICPKCRQGGLIDRTAGPTQVMLDGEAVDFARNNSKLLNFHPYDDSGYRTALGPDEAEALLATKSGIVWIDTGQPWGSG